MTYDAQMDVDESDGGRGLAASRCIASSGHSNCSNSDDHDHAPDVGDQTRQMASAMISNDIEGVNDASVQTVTQTPKTRKKQDRRGKHFGEMIPYVTYFGINFGIFGLTWGNNHYILNLLN